MNVAISIILLISYLAFVIYIMKGGNLLMGFIMMSCVDSRWRAGRPD